MSAAAQQVKCAGCGSIYLVAGGINVFTCRCGIHTPITEMYFFQPSEAQERFFHLPGCKKLIDRLACTCTTSSTKETGMNLYQVAIVGGTTLEPELVFGIETLFAQDDVTARQATVQKAVEAGKKFDAGKVRVIVKAFA
jgi:hypothetical protein